MRGVVRGRAEGDGGAKPAFSSGHLVELDQGLTRAAVGAPHLHGVGARGKIREKGGAKLAAISAEDVQRIDDIEKVTRHDVIAFLTHLSEIVGPEARFVHQGMTSSDVLDTCLAVMHVLHDGLADSKYRPCPTKLAEVSKPGRLPDWLPWCHLPK